MPILAASPDLSSPRAADHQVFAQIPPASDSASSSFLCSASYHPVERWEETALGATGWALAGEKHGYC